MKDNKSIFLKLDKSKFQHWIYLQNVYFFILKSHKIFIKFDSIHNHVYILPQIIFQFNNNVFSNQGLEK